MVAVDGHVHFHDAFDLERFLDSAAANLERARRDSGVAGRTTGVLMLAECSGVRRFDEWWSRHGEPASGSWSFVRNAEETSLRAQHRNGKAVTVVAGRQVVTAEQIEVLALGVRDELQEGRALFTTLDAVERAGGLPVLPWGVGKWIGKRGALVASAFARSNGLHVFAGDNGGRWRALPRPPLLVRAERAGVPVLPGSDPLPFAGEERRVGAFGFSLEGTLDPSAPARSIREALLARPTLVAFGRGTPLARFLALQCAMQLRRRRRPSAR